MKLHEKIFRLVILHKSCVKTKNKKALIKVKKEIKKIFNSFEEKNGIDVCELDLNESNEKLFLLYISYHHMDKNGNYDIITDNAISVRKTLSGINIFVSSKGNCCSISHRNKNNVKNIISDMFFKLLNQNCTFDNFYS